MLLLILCAVLEFSFAQENSQAAQQASSFSSPPAAPSAFGSVYDTSDQSGAVFSSARDASLSSASNYGPLSSHSSSASKLGRLQPSLNAPFPISPGLVLHSGDAVTLQSLPDYKYLKQACCAVRRLLRSPAMMLAAAQADPSLSNVALIAAEDHTPNADAQFTVVLEDQPAQQSQSRQAQKQVRCWPVRCLFRFSFASERSMIVPVVGHFLKGCLFCDTVVAL